MNTLKNVISEKIIINNETLKKVDLNNYTLKQKQSLKEGYDIWCSGCLSGDWEDLEFQIKYSNNSNYEYFVNVFRDILDLNNFDVVNILRNTFSDFESKKPITKDYIGYSFWKNLRSGNIQININPLVDLVIKKYEENKIPYLKSDIENKVWNKIYKERYNVIEYLF